MNVICIQEEAFNELIDQVYRRVKQLYEADHKSQWISGEAAMKYLNIKSKTTLQAMRDTGAIRYSQPSKKVILYDINSINEYLEDHAMEVF